MEEFVNFSKQSIVKNSEEEAVFIKVITNSFKELDTSNLSDSNWLENTVNSFANSVERACQDYKNWTLFILFFFLIFIFIFIYFWFFYF